jgi:NADH:ubiquinone oxidoreductase subunit 3 (subunit A)
MNQFDSPRSRSDIGDMSVAKMLIIALLAFLTFTILTSAIHEIGIIVSTAVLGGTVIHSTISWFWGATNITGSLVPWQMFLVLTSGTLFVSVFILILLFYPEPLYTNIAATVLGFRNLIDGAPFLSGSDGFQAAKISLIGAWVWYVVLFLIFAFAVAYSAGYHISLKEEGKWI